MGGGIYLNKVAVACVNTKMWGLMDTSVIGWALGAKVVVGGGVHVSME